MFFGLPYHGPLCLCLEKNDFREIVICIVVISRDETKIECLYITDLASPHCVLLMREVVGITYPYVSFLS